MSSDFFAHETAVIDEGAQIGDLTRIWHFSHVCAGAKIGKGCSLGQNVMIADGVEIGDGVKIQNNVSIYAGTIVEDDVFLGPSCVFTNISNPRSQVSRRELYEETVVEKGATIGANATIVCGSRLGRYAFVAAGAVVASDIPNYGFYLGVPARQRGWMSRHGHSLDFENSDTATCRESGYRYVLENQTVRCLDLDENAPLPENLSVGSKRYQEFGDR